MSATNETRYRFRDYGCHECKMLVAFSRGYLADLARESLLRRAVAPYGSVDYRDDGATLLYVAEALAAAEHGLCRECHEKQIMSVAGVAVALLAGRSAA